MHDLRSYRLKLLGLGRSCYGYDLLKHGNSYGAAKAGMVIAFLSVTRPHMAFKSIIPIIMAGILWINGLIMSVLLSQKINVSLETPGPPFIYLCAGLLCGFSNVAAGCAIGLVGELGIKFYAINEAIFVALSSF